MSKKKNTTENNEENNENLEDKILKEFKDCITNAEYVKNLRTEIVHISPKFDIGLGGGIPFGSFVIISGKHSQGKSSLSLQIAANAQQVSGKHTREVFYFDIEGRIKYKDLIGNSKLDLSDNRFKLIQSKPGNILTGDQFIDIAEKLIHTKPGCIFILDSLSAICTKGKQEADIKDRYRDDANLLLSSFCKRISQVVAINQSIIIGVCHLIADPGPSRSQFTESGGNKIKYAADVKIMGTYFQPWEVNKNIIGQITHWKIDKSALGPPFGEVSSYIRYGYGFDDHMEILDLACDIGIIKKSGAWFSYKDLKFQGMENFRSGILETPDIFNEIKDQIESIFIKKS